MTLSEKPAVPARMRIPVTFRVFAETRGLASKAPSEKSSAKPGQWRQRTRSYKCHTSVSPHYWHFWGWLLRIGHVAQAAH